ncbi:MAG TPA: hypothetical protein VNA87_03930 [Actinomycetota bacterium]|nr:hypothetical protein [Actinomycetota bacterium]
MHQTDACNDCFVMAILNRKDERLVIDPEGQEAINSLQQAGLAPLLKFKRKAG